VDSSDSSSILDRSTNSHTGVAPSLSARPSLVASGVQIVDSLEEADLVGGS